MATDTKNFKVSEFNCHCGCGYNVIDQHVINMAQAIRDELGVPVKVNSGCRCENNNSRAGGVKGSFYVKNTFVRDWFYLLRARRGTKKALIAVARILPIVWHILYAKEKYEETRYEETQRRQEERRRQKLKSEASKLGFKLIPA